MVRNCLISSGNPVGAGSFGVVNLAMNKFTGELFAVKTAYSGPGLRSLENEAEILKSLDSPYIIPCLGRDFTYEPNGERRLKIFLEYQAGGSISDVLNNFGVCLISLSSVVTPERFFWVSIIYTRTAWFTVISNVRICSWGRLDASSRQILDVPGELTQPRRLMLIQSFVGSQLLGLHYGQHQKF